MEKSEGKQKIVTWHQGFQCFERKEEKKKKMSIDTKLEIYTDLIMHVYSVGGGACFRNSRESRA